MTDTRAPSEHLVVRVLRLQIEGGHLWLDPAALTEDMIARWFGVPRLTAARALRTLCGDPSPAVDEPAQTARVHPSQAATHPRPTASTVTDADLDLLYAELARLHAQLSQRRSAA
ncbi:hypothetical protein [Streptomyces sp. NPDC002611]